MDDPRKILCKYFMSGACREGENCRFSHEWKSRPEMVCRYYLQGTCSYGKKCRYDHTKPTEQEKPSRKSREIIPPCPPAKHSFGEVAAYKSRMTTLTESALTIDMTTLTAASGMPENWAEAPEFVPSWMRETVDNDLDEFSSLYSTITKAGAEVIHVLSAEESAKLLCPFAAMGSCEFESCPYLHGSVCDFCGKQCLHPYNLEQQHDHIRECQRSLEENIEHTFAMKRSQGIQCSICLDVVLDKRKPADRRFGILSECSHPFCLPCIRKWRNLSHADNKIIRACPICRVPSNFVTPSEVWIEEVEEKQRLIEGYKTALSSIPCKYYDFGVGSCPFGSSCFYKHTTVEGKVEVPDIQLRHYTDSDGDSRAIRKPRLWDFLKARTEAN
ncbi:E3 ubiquitin-protein ligase makorin-1-like [Corticium candelabrum]|uniref:E3 ubiquitin-protein ligase makorin-1-like n=1 Tax=Corticium candelabrum TaxID=121492 RepID=UPI002E274EB8|nr:E3 ubiquitin-protein ligase makorin-1-like [Corticium candelabrum]